jgi:Insertion element 4 transposase N-terminal/Transposase DDE domain
MLVATSWRKRTCFQQLLPVELPPAVSYPQAGPPPVLARRPRDDPREFSPGLLRALCPPELVERLLAEYGRQEHRCRLLPARLMVYALLLMCLSADLSYAKLVHHLGALSRGGGNWRIPDKSAFARARRRLGWEVMEGLFRALAQPLGDVGQDPWCAWRGRRVVALDGTTLELTRNQELERAFGGQRNPGYRGGGRIGPPRVRLVTLLECGTRALLDVGFGPYHQGENSLARRLRAVLPGMLVLADRGFPSKPLWEAYLGAGADLLWRVKGNIARRRIRTLGDGSYLVRFGKGVPLTVRVIEYQLQGSCEVYRLLTNLLDPGAASALELAQLYTERWESETLAREIKIGQCEAGALRSQTELGVRQEIWSTCLLHVLNRKLAHQAAAQVPGGDPDRISFSLTQDAIRRSVGRVLVISRRALKQALDAAITELSALRNLVFRRARSCPRIVYQERSRYGNRARYPSQRSILRPLPQIALCGA